MQEKGIVIIMNDNKNKQKKSHKARNAYIIYVVVLATLILFFMMYSFKSLTLYEEAQPKYVMEQVLSDFSEQGLSMANLSSLTFSEYNPEDIYVSEMNSLIQNSNLTYKKIRENYSDGSLIYNIYADDLLIAECSLLPKESYNRMYILTITNWEFSQIVPLGYQQNYSAEITVPEDYEVSVNNSILDQSFRTASEVNSSLSYCEEYVTIPEIVTYQIGSFSHPLDIQIKNYNGEIIYTQDLPEYSLSENAVKYLLSSTALSEEETKISLSYGYATPEISEELSTMVFEGVERYSNFFSRDLDGCLESIAPIQDLFPEDSIYLSLADQYRREDIRVFSSHSNTHFINEEISEYTVYSKDCFSCRVKFDKSMTLGGREMIDTTNNVYYYVRLNDQWVIADIK